MEVAGGGAAFSRSLVPGANEIRALFERVVAERFEVESRLGRFFCAGWRAQLRELDSVGPGTFLAGLDLEFDALPAGERIEVDARVKSRPVEEILPAILRGDEPKATI